jgi:hypothetical protein
MNPVKILARLRELSRTILENPRKLNRIQIELEQIKINQGTIISALNDQRAAADLMQYEFKIFSQWGEDGIIQHLVKTVPIKNKTFIEFGVEDFSESNCRFLMMKDNWKGFVIDGSEENISKIRNSYYFWRHQLSTIAAFITAENINHLLARSGFDRDVGILSLDIDGNDFYILQAIDNYNPRILICEYNSIFGSERKISVPYSSDFHRTAKHYSNLYFGASLSAMTYLANKKGYTLVGTNSAGGNAFYVRNDLVTDRFLQLTAEQAYFPSNCRESRDQHGNLTYLSGEERYDLIAGMPVFNVETEELEKL